ncbi:hypothetical protein EOD42_13835 [Rhodovarius crocodyli]|uniref:Uncharacterized protein n=1 Tax=Rhodovarius crocodyli TaxID=1979269 RepID=A0A437MEY9_9PROT|nr:hypothetical protein [Rhodovarius crocodyli]RVT96193.1 hypothetical protein EOD42_13835 [Rhodovarius crocodyli]
MLNSVILLVQICMAPASGGILLQGCVHRTYESTDCASALAMAASIVASDRVVVPGGCVNVMEPARRAAARGRN